MATLTKDRALKPLLENANINIRKQLSSGDWDANTFSFDLIISPPWSSDPAERKQHRDYKIRMTAADAFRLATAIINEIHGGMNMTRKEKP